MITAFKATRASGRDFYSDTFQHEVGAVLTEPNAREAGAGCCKPGLHVSPTARLAARCSNGLTGSTGASRPWRFWRVSIEESDVLDREDKKWRVRAYRVEAELSLADVFGASLSAAVDKGRAEIATWKSIPWLKPQAQTDEEWQGIIRPLLAQWHAAVSPWLAKRGITRELPRTARIIRDRAAAAAAAAAADADADAAAADADAADADAAAADADAAAADAADAALYRLWPYWMRWYVRPRWALWRNARWKMFMGEQPNPWEPIVEMFRLGLAPIGYSKGEFCVYVPVVQS